MSNATFQKLPIDALLATWRLRLPKDISQAYQDMGRIIADRDLNLKVLFDELVTNSASASGGTISIGDPLTNGSWRLIIVSTELKVQKREAGVWNDKFTFTV